MKRKKHRPAGLDVPQPPKPQCTHPDHKGSKFAMGTFFWRETGLQCRECVDGK